MAFVYILEDVSGRYYVGRTDDLKRRMRQHEKGHTYTTCRTNNLEVVFAQEFDTLREARSVELSLKKLKRKDYLAKIVNDGYIRKKK